MIRLHLIQWIANEIPRVWQLKSSWSSLREEMHLIGVVCLCIATILHHFEYFCKYTYEIRPKSLLRLPQFQRLSNGKNKLLSFFSWQFIGICWFLWYHLWIVIPNWHLHAHKKLYTSATNCIIKIKQWLYYTIYRIISFLIETISNTSSQEWLVTFEIVVNVL
jgi:hypothetical protein